MIPTPKAVERVLGACFFVEGPGWWLYFREPDYTYDTAYYVPDDGEYVPSNPSKAPVSVNLPHTWQPPAPPVRSSYAAQAYYGGMDLAGDYQ